MYRVLKAVVKYPVLVRHVVRSWLWQHMLSCPFLQIGAGALIIGDRYMRIGEGFRAGRGLWMEAVTKYGQQTYTPMLSIGERFSASDGVHIACAFSVLIGKDVLVGSKVHITDHNHGLYQDGVEASTPSEPPATRMLHGSPVRIGDRVFLADGVVVLPGSHIAEGVVVGTNSVVQGYLEPNTIYVGAPAKAIKHFDEVKKIWIRKE